MGVEDHSELRPIYDRTFAGRFQRMLKEFVEQFMIYETGYEPGIKVVYDPTVPNASHQAISLKTYMAVPGPRIEINATVTDA